MRLINNVTLVAVCNNGFYREITAKKMEDITSKFKFEEVLYFTDFKLNKIYNNVINVVIPFSFQDKSTSYFKLAELPTYIKTTHYLIMDHNIYPNNPDGWSDEFLKYHFVGQRWKHHPENYIPPHKMCGPKTDVGAGPMSLQSRLLGLAVSSIYKESLKQPNFVPELWEPDNYYVGRDLRGILEQKGFTFSPKEVADKFLYQDTTSLGDRYYGLYTNI